MSQDGISLECHCVSTSHKGVTEVVSGCHGGLMVFFYVFCSKTNGFDPSGTRLKGCYHQSMNFPNLHFSFESCIISHTKHQLMVRI